MDASSIAPASRSASITGKSSTDPPRGIVRRGRRGGASRPGFAFAFASASQPGFAFVSAARFGPRLLRSSSSRGGGHRRGRDGRGRRHPRERHRQPRKRRLRRDDAARGGAVTRLAQVVIRLRHGLVPNPDDGQHAARVALHARVHGGRCCRVGGGSDVFAGGGVTVGASPDVFAERARSRPVDGGSTVRSRAETRRSAARAVGETRRVGSHLSREPAKRSGVRVDHVGGIGVRGARASRLFASRGAGSCRFASRRSHGDASNDAGGGCRPSPRGPRRTSVRRRRARDVAGRTGAPARRRRRRRATRSPLGRCARRRRRRRGRSRWRFGNHRGGDAGVMGSNPGATRAGARRARAAPCGACRRPPLGDPRGAARRRRRGRGR